MSIEDIELENFSALPNDDINSTTLSRQRHTVFHYLLSDDSKNYSATNTAYSNSLITLLKDKNINSIIE